MARDREELERIRRANRQALGMSGVSGMGSCSSPGDRSSCCESCARGQPCSGGTKTAGLANIPPQTVRAFPMGMAGSVPGGSSFDSFLMAMPKVGLETSFPPVNVEYDPSQPTPPSSGSAVSDWVMAHLVRPVIRVGGIRVAPYESEANYSDVANAAAIATGVVGLGFFGWMFYRAFLRSTK